MFIRKTELPCSSCIPCIHCQCSLQKHVNNHTDNVNGVTFVTRKHMSPEGPIFDTKWFVRGLERKDKSGGGGGNVVHPFSFCHTSSPLVIRGGWHLRMKISELDARENLFLDRFSS